MERFIADLVKSFESGKVDRDALIIRSRDVDAPPANGGSPRPKPEALINHIAYTIADFDQARVREELKSMGVANVRDTGANSVHMDDLNGYDIEISGPADNALTDGQGPPAIPGKAHAARREGVFPPPAMLLPRLAACDDDAGKPSAGNGHCSFPAVPAPLAIAMDFSRRICYRHSLLA
jgi:hypothetical protein